jgi:chitin disaccharide deacetylase
MIRPGGSGGVGRGETKETSSMDERTTNALLGYRDDARLLIVNADDFGMCHAINAGILRALTEGVVRSTTLMAPCPWAPHAMQLLKDNPEIAFGVHLTLVCDFGGYKWRPMASTDSVSSLVDEAGYFYSDQLNPGLIALAKIDEVEREFRAQIEAVLAVGLKPTHLDWHCLADGGREDIFDISLTLAREYGFALRVHLRPSAEKSKRAGIPVVDHGVLDSYRLGSDDKSAKFVELLRALPAGLTEWAVHPSLGDAEAQAMEPTSWQVRRADFDFVMSAEAREIIHDEKIVLLDYRALQSAISR